MLPWGPSPEDLLADCLGALASRSHPAAVCPWTSPWKVGPAVSKGQMRQLFWPCPTQSGPERYPYLLLQRPCSSSCRPFKGGGDAGNLSPSSREQSQSRSRTPCSPPAPAASSMCNAPSPANVLSLCPSCKAVMRLLLCPSKLSGSYLSGAPPKTAEHTVGAP